MKKIILILGALICMITSCEKEPIEVKESLSKFIIYDTYKEDEVEYKLRTDYDLIYKGFLLEKINVRKISIPQYLDSTEVVSEGTILFRYNVRITSYNVCYTKLLRKT